MRSSLLSAALAAAVLLASVPATPAKHRSSQARAWLESGLGAMGGAERIRGLQSLHLEGYGRRVALEQSERPDGPWISEFQQIIEDRDVRGARMRRTVKAQFATYDFTQTMVVDGGAVAIDANGRFVPYLPGADEWLALGPERVLLTALNAPDVTAARDVTLQGVLHHEVDFTWHGAPVRVFLNANTSLPTAVEITRPYAYAYYSIWGDVATRAYFSSWLVLPGGLRYPMQWDVEQNGTASQSVFLTKVVVNPPLPSEGLSIPEDVAAAVKARAAAHGDDVRLGRPDQPTAEIAPGIVQIPGGFNTAIVRQNDGLVILEAPVSSQYSAKVIDEAERRFPGQKVKAVITTSDAWPHLGGLREYVARGVPVYLLDANVPIVRRLLDAPFRTCPDALARAPKKPRFHVVASKTTIGTGRNRLEIYPFRTETGERQMMVYFPEHRLLYGSDLAQPPESAAPWAAEYYDEIQSAVSRERLTVDRVFAMHMRPVAWTDLLDRVRNAMVAN